MCYNGNTGRNKAAVISITRFHAMESKDLMSLEHWTKKEGARNEGCFGADMGICNF